MGDVRQELLPCPLCGNNVNDDEGCFPASKDRGWRIRCGNPSCTASVVHDSRAEAIRAWNRRPLSARAAVPEGYFVAPIVPSAAMQMAGTAGTCPSETWACMAQQAIAESQFATLLAAAPQPNATCTCPSGDGSLRHPCPAHPTAATQPASEAVTWTNPAPHASAPREPTRNAAVSVESGGCAPPIIAPAPSAPAPINRYPEIPDNCVDSLAAADLEALATSIGVYTPADPSCRSDGWWAFTAADLHDFARCLSGAQQAAEDFELPIPMGCQCQADVEIGTHANQVELETPEFMRALGRVGCLTFRETTSVDRCVAPLVQALWERGVITTGSCCGHNQRGGYIGIYVAAHAAKDGAE